MFISRSPDREFYLVFGGHQELNRNQSGIKKKRPVFAEGKPSGVIMKSKYTTMVECDRKFTIDVHFETKDHPRGNKQTPYDHLALSF